LLYELRQDKTPGRRESESRSPRSVVGKPENQGHGLSAAGIFSKGSFNRYAAA
jgi:hypothetical protein